MDVRREGEEQGYLALGEKKILELKQESPRSQSCKCGGDIFARQSKQHLQWPEAHVSVMFLRNQKKL